MANSSNPYGIIKQFEQRMAEYAGSKYAVAVDSCTAALFLSLRWSKISGVRLPPSTLNNDAIVIPRKTFVSVPMMAIHAGWKIKWQDHDWQPAGGYLLWPATVIDSALNLHRRMFEKFELDAVGRHKFVCLSFQYRKHLPIGRGGMILHDDPEADEWFRRARFFGRHEVPMNEEPGPAMIGWHMYMEPERAARGLQLMMHYPDNNEPLRVDYPDISKYKVFEEHTV